MPGRAPGRADSARVIIALSTPRAVRAADVARGAVDHADQLAPVASTPSTRALTVRYRALGGPGGSVQESKLRRPRQPRAYGDRVRATRRRGSRRLCRPLRGSQFSRGGWIEPASSAAGAAVEPASCRRAACRQLGGCVRADARGAQVAGTVAGGWWWTPRRSHAPAGSDCRFNTQSASRRAPAVRWAAEGLGWSRSRADTGASSQSATRFAGRRSASSRRPTRATRLPSGWSFRTRALGCETTVFASTVPTRQDRVAGPIATVIVSPHPVGYAFGLVLSSPTSWATVFARACEDEHDHGSPPMMW